jgi:two-component system, OmpR family, response regulator
MKYEKEIRSSPCPGPGTIPVRIATGNGKEQENLMKDTVLIVDDSTFIVEGLVALLKKNYLPVPSYGGEECLSLLRTIKPSIIILDIMMEPMDGWETLARIKENPATRHIPVLMFSAKKISPEEAEAHRIIIDDFLTKPVNPKKLLEAIEKVLARQESNRQITSTWNEAGVSPVIIEEYLTLKTNLDVDASLLAVMKKQLDIAYPDAVNRGELERSIAALEDRIGVSRARIEAFCREKAAILPVRSGEGGRILSPDPEPVPVPAPAFSAPAPETAHGETVPDVIEPPAFPVPAPETAPVPGTCHEETIRGVTEPPVFPAPALETAPEVAVLNVTGHPAESLQPVNAPGSGPDPVTEETPGTAPLSGTVTATVPPEEEEPRPVSAAFLFTPSILSPSPDRESTTPPEPGTGSRDPEPATLAPEVPEPAPAGEDADTPESSYLKSLFEPIEPRDPGQPVRQEPGAGEITSPRTLPSRPRPSPEEPPAHPPGAGTETPRMRAGETTSRELKWELEQKEMRQSREPAPSGSIFSRIIAAISALFGKKAR